MSDRYTQTKLMFCNVPVPAELIARRPKSQWRCRLMFPVSGSTLMIAILPCHTILQLSLNGIQPTRIIVLGQQARGTGLQASKELQANLTMEQDLIPAI